MKSARFTLPLAPSVNANYSSVIKERDDGTSYTRRVAAKELRLFKKDVSHAVV